MIFSTDGELIILLHAFDQDVIDAFNSVFAHYAKGPPSATSVHQPADVRANFRSIKTGIKEVDKKNKQFHNSTLEANINEAISAMKKEFTSVALSALKMRKIVEGLQKIVFVMRDGYLTSAEAAQGFVKCGQHILIPAEGDTTGITVDYDRIMSKT